MITIKSFTSLEQSKKLAEILPLESADMEYLAIKESGKLVGNVPFAKDDSEVEDSVKGEITMTTIKQPEWCNYPDAAVPFWGCWSLLAGMVESEGYCKKCELYKEK